MNWTAESAEAAAREMVASGSLTLDPCGNPGIVKAALFVLLGDDEISWERVAEIANYYDDPMAVVREADASA